MKWCPSRPVRVTLITATVGITIIGLLAAFLRRRKKRKGRPGSGYTQPPVSSLERTANPNAPLTINPSLYHRGLNGDLHGYRNSNSPALSFRTGSSGRNTMTRSSSVRSNMSAASTEASTVMMNPQEDPASFTPEQLCDLGLESLQYAIQNWECALDKLDNLPDSEMVSGVQELAKQLHYLLEKAYRLRDSYEQRMFHQLGENMAVDSAIHALQEMDKEFEKQKRRSRGSGAESSSDQESFVSATDFADLSDLDAYIQRDVYHHMAMYEVALRELKQGNIPCRTIRTKMLKCSSDTEFLAKLYCVRQGFDEMFQDESVRDWLLVSLKDVISKLMEKADRDPVEFQITLETMVEFLKKDDSWGPMEEELKGRGVTSLSFYDVAVDFILFDAFTDLENPPSSVTAVVQNRWLSNGFKETALSTACWSVLKAKRRMLKYPDGFIGHFYSISEHTSPVLAWGFLGPSGPLKDLCNFFKDQILGFMCDVFDFTKVRYTNIKQMAEDMLQLARRRQATLARHMGIPVS